MMEDFFIKHKGIIKIIIITILLSIAIFGCKSPVQYIPIETVHTEYINKYLRDSVWLYDSIHVKEKGDTVWLEKYKYAYRDKYRVDTIIKIDTLSVPYPVKGDPIPYVTGWQNFQIWCGRILLALLLLFVGYNILKKKILPI